MTAAFTKTLEHWNALTLELVLTPLTDYPLFIRYLEFEVRNWERSSKQTPSLKFHFAPTSVCQKVTSNLKSVIETSFKQSAYFVAPSTYRFWTAPGWELVRLHGLLAILHSEQKKNRANNAPPGTVIIKYLEQSKLAQTSFNAGNYPD